MSERARDSESERVCVCERESERESVCVRERERERESERERVTDAPLSVPLMKEELRAYGLGFRV